MSRLIIHPDARLSEKAQPVTNFYVIPTLAAMMHREMRHQNALGLAANQFELGTYASDVAPCKGIPRVIVMADGSTYVNPTWEPNGTYQETALEGCLSLPGLMIPMSRPMDITVRAYNEHGEQVIHRLWNIWARVFQHECDHLDGHLISTDVIL